jgi:Baseplate hub gp41
MSKLYIRNARLTVGTKQFSTRVAFNIVKGTNGKAANKGKVSVYNLAEDSRSFIEKSDALMKVEAGYGDNLSVIYLGDIKKVEHKRSGPDVVTTLECGDGEKKLTDAHIEISLGADAKVNQIINAAVSALGIDRGVIKNIPQTVFQNGFAFSGKVSDLLDRIAKKEELDWSVQDGALQIYPTGEDTGETAVLLNENTGLLGVPNKTEDGFVAKSLLNPDIIPGRQIQVESKFLTGRAIFVAEKVNHIGDVREGDFVTKVEGKGKLI